MNNRLPSIGIVCLLVTAGILGFITFESEVMSAKTLYVGGIGPLNYSKIQDAINAANPGDTVYVYHGKYPEKVLVNKTINLIGENRDTTIIDGIGVTGSTEIVTVTENCVNITGFTITYTGPLIPQYASGIMIDSDYNTVLGNKVSNIWIAIYLRYSSGNNIIGNTMIENGIVILGDQIKHWNTHNIDISNTVKGKPVHYWKNQTGGTIPMGAGQVILANCTNVRVDGQELTNGSVGIQLGFSSNNNITRNTVSSNNWYGIRLHSSDENNITGNRLENNYFDGLYLNYSGRNNIIGNIFSSSRRGNGIHFDTSDGNYITGNTIFLNDNYGIYLDNSNENFINDNDVSSTVTHAGIMLISSWRNTIENNTCYSNGYSGFHLYLSNENDIIGNNASSNTYLGFNIHSSSGNNIQDNTASHNNYDGIMVLGFVGNNIINNIASSNSRYGIYLRDTIGNNVIGNDVSDNDEDGISLYNSGYNNIMNNNAPDNHNGIHLELLSNNNIITDNIMSSNNNDGILLSFSSNNNITANVVSDNLEGINVTSSDNNIITGNNVSNNGYGIHIEGSLNNRIYHNNILNNTNQAYDDTNNGNEWDNGYPSGGNYWSDFDEPGEGAHDDYQGVDQNFMGSDGIVDLGPPSGGKNPYIIDSDSQDNYPLIKFVAHLFLYEGWNLISIPFIQPNTNLGIVLNSIKGSYDAVQWYNVSDNSDPWKHSSTKKPSHLNDLDDIHHKMGFWIHITKPGGVLFQYSGVQPIENQSITLHPGWNLIGYPSLTSFNRTQGLNNITFGTDVDSIWTYNAATQKWEEIGELDYFELGRGYWIHSKVIKTWNVPL